MESILSESKREQRVIVQENENSADLSKRKDDRPIFAEIAPTKILRIIENLERKEVRHMQRHWKVLEHQTLVGKLLKH